MKKKTVKKLKDVKDVKERYLKYEFDVVGEQYGTMVEIAKDVSLGELIQAQKSLSETIAKHYELRNGNI